MANKTISRIFKQPATHDVGDGFKVSNYIPGPDNLQQETSPFILLDYNPPYHFAPSAHRKGVGAHPHRGFETVTLVYEGDIHHRDTSGNSGAIHNDEVQWMTAASGVLHEEFQGEKFSQEGGTQHIAQIWVNLPAKDKMLAPAYQTLTRENTPSVKVDDKGSEVRILAGRFKGIAGTAHTHSPIEMYDIRLKAGAGVSFPIPEAYNTLALITKGEIRINEKDRAVFKDLVLFNHQGENISLKADVDSYILLLSGEPLKEPIASYGPFVMNTRAEIIQAINDFNEGKFGELHSDGYARTKTMKNPTDNNH